MTNAPTADKTPDIAQSSPLPAGNLGEAMRAPATVYSKCDPKSDASGNLSFNPNAQVFNPKTGRNVVIPTVTIPAGQHLVRGFCVVGGDIDHIRVFYIITLSTPSSGLTPESQTSSVVAFDPFSAGSPQTAALPADIDSANISAIYPSDYGFFVSYQRNKESPLGEFDGFDGTSLAKTFTITEPGPLPQQFINSVGILVYVYGGAVTIYSLRDGHVVLQNEGSRGGNVPVSYPHGFVFNAKTDAGPQYSYFDMTDGQLKTPFPLTGDVWANTFLTLGEHSLEIRDMSSNAVIFRREGPDYDGLHVKSAYIAGKYLYIANDSDSPVIDITTSQKVSTNWKVRPTDVINKNWIIVKNDTSGLNSPGSCFATDTAVAKYSDNQLTCAQGDATLKYAPNGNYAGPWY